MEWILNNIIELYVTKYLFTYLSADAISLLILVLTGFLAFEQWLAARKELKIFGKSIDLVRINSTLQVIRSIVVFILGIFKRKPNDINNTPASPKE